MPHLGNWICGWCLTLAGFLTGAAIGLFFASDDFLGGYASFPRRLIRLGHIALIALGFFNIVYAIAPLRRDIWQTSAASWALMLGGILMPAVCFLSAWKVRFKNLFIVPVSALITAVVFILIA